MSLLPFEKLPSSVESYDDAYWIDAWNTRDRKCVSEKVLGHDRNEHMANWIEFILNQAKILYYLNGTSPMSDKIYDRFESDLRTLKPDSVFLKKVGYTIPFPTMPSGFPKPPPISFPKPPGIK